MEQTVNLAERHRKLMARATQGLVGAAAAASGLRPYRKVLRRMSKQLRRRARVALRREVGK